MPAQGHQTTAPPGHIPYQAGASHGPRFTASSQYDVACQGILLTCVVQTSCACVTVAGKKKVRCKGPKFDHDQYAGANNSQPIDLVRWGGICSSGKG
ncbi:hypothetical protein PISMIDRAFT_673661 [Pisolithus microcarpus 441]|uniref:Uncharacterized protein n=1 Tax=Pisolithus microcarpus 441 TaxID=765257 RepID=A0A0C9YUE3_9AGAM|nr:hypothetical protein PISMIDRAFT_673661 [Pisolithus microcarpus 441]